MSYKPLKLWFDEACVQLLLNKLQDTNIIEANDIQVEADQIKALDTLELKDRVEWIADLLQDKIPGDYQIQLEALVGILGPENEEETGMFTNFYWVMPIAKFVEKYGIDDLDHSMDAIAEITKRNTGEFTVRPFLIKYPSKGLAQMKAWAQSDNLHLRRLASEGMRPRLPWASKLSAFIDNPSPVLEILEILKDDPSRFVQKSVANTLNDILKDNEVIALETIRNWAQEPSFERAWIIRHAIRNYRKKKIDWALDLTEKMKQIKR